MEISKCLECENPAVEDGLCRLHYAIHWLANNRRTKDNADFMALCQWEVMDHQRLERDRTGYPRPQHLTSRAKSRHGRLL